MTVAYLKKHSLLHQKVVEDRKVSKNSMNLPIEKIRKALVPFLLKNKVLIIYGETGSGKSTKIPQILLNLDGYSNSYICCTQPRRIAAVSLALRVSKELESEIGCIVGFSIRFEENVSIRTRIKYCTDGILLKELSSNPLLIEYSHIIIDEAHERTLNTDILLGLSKSIMKKNKKISFIVTSATIDIKKFSWFLNKCPIFTIPGKRFKVSILFIKKLNLEYLKMAIQSIIYIHKRENPGDILVFLTGKSDIEFIENFFTRNIHKINNKSKYKLNILKIFSNLPVSKQSLIFSHKSRNTRRCILSTNITETSLTIPSIRYVIDSGYVKSKFYDPKANSENLLIVPISKSSADQRAGRSGRVCDGKCFRLYTEYIYNNEMRKSNIPEIKRSNLLNTILILKTLGYLNVMSFDFIDKPSTFVIGKALEELYILKALNKNGLLTNSGRLMSLFPIDPKLSRVLLVSITFLVPIEISIIIGIISNSSNLFHEKSAVSLKKEIKYFNSLYGDHITYLNIYKEWVKNNCSREWCLKNALSYLNLVNSKKICKQLLFLVKKLNIKIICKSSNYTSICKSFTKGFSKNIARKIKTGYYKIIYEKSLYKLHPRSSLLNTKPNWIVFEKIVNINGEYLYNVSKTKPEWSAYLNTY